MSLPMVSYSSEDYKHTVTQIIQECMTKANRKLSELSSAEAKWRTEVGILCRLCAKSDYACISILRGRGKDLNLKPKIRKYIHLEINEEEKLPDQVCPLCLSAIKSWDEYAYVCNSASAREKEEEEIKYEDVDINFGTEEKMGSFGMIKSEPKWEGDVTTVCFLCQKSDDNFIIVLPEEGTNSSLQIKIKKYLDIDVQEGSQICCLCVNAVNSWQEFVERCLFTNDIFQELFNSLETEERILKRIKYLIEQHKNTWNSLAVKTEDITIKEEEIEKVLEEDENTKVNKLNDGRNESESEILSASSNKLTPDTDPQKKQKRVEGSSEESESSEYVDSDESFSDYSSETYITIPVMKLFQCNVCSTKFPSYLSLAAHKMAAHHKRTCQCKICFVVFDTPDRLTKHENKKHKWKFSYSNFKDCPICSEKIPKRELRYHLTFHNTLCVICGEVYLSHEAYKEHMKNHNENILCGVCSKIYVSESNYLVNYKSHLPDDKLDKFKCKRCNKPYKSNLGFKRHIDDVQNLKFIAKCKICDKVLTNKRSYNLHMNRTHSADRPYKCDLCKISVKSRPSLRRHINKHNVIRKKSDEYNCSVCQKTFTSEVGLMIHTSYHSEESGRCLCHVCGVLLKNNTTLSFHLINHDKNRPYKFYSRLSQKKLNRNETVRWEHFFCSVCNEGFTRKAYLIKHIKVAHT